jgi:y4mF family transcriptional regulator
VTVSDRETALAAAVRARRKELGLRQEELADLAGVSERFVFAVESGKASVRLDKLMDLFDALGLHLQLRRGRAEGVQVGTGLDG